MAHMEYIGLDYQVSWKILKGLFSRLVFMPIIVLFFFANQGFSQNELFFKQLTESFTNTIIKDADGFIWVGTQDGLLRYDNNEFKSFRHKKDEQHSLPNNYIWTIVEDLNENLWIGTFGGGLAMWDKTKEKFFNFENKIDQGAASIHALEIYQDSLLLVGTETGLFTFNIEVKKYVDSLNCLNSNDCFINDIYVSDQGDAYIATNGGVFVKESTSKTYEKLILDHSDSPVHCIEGIAHRIYIGTDNGLFTYNQRKKIVNHQLADKVVVSILPINTEEWYVGTNTGLGQFSNKDGYIWHREELAGENTLKSDFIHTLYEIEDEIVWAGTRKGIHQFTIKPPVFQNLNRIYNNSICSPTALGMTEDKNANVWICSREGLLFLDMEGNKDYWEAKCYNPQNTPEMRNAYTINITKDSKDDLWLAYRKNGFSRIRQVGSELIWTDFPKVNSILNGDGINQVFEDSDGTYWLATRGKGLMQFDPQTEEIITYDVSNGLSHPYVFRIFEDSEQRLWLSTANGGLCQFDKKGKSFNCYTVDRNNPSSIAADMVLSTSQFSDNRLLVSTVNGLNILEKDATFRLINMLDGLTNNIIYGALEDDNGYLWVSTNEGISRLDISGDEVKTINYTKENGLGSKEFNQHSFLEHSSGLFFFGGVEGVTFFDPIKIESEKIKASIVFTDFQLFNNSVPVDGTSANEFTLQKSINETSEIKLDYNENSIAFEFAALAYGNAGTLTYLHKMEGLEEEWIASGNRNYVSYPKVPPGNYQFKVRLMDQNEQILDVEKSINIYISRPPWKTWWAYLFYLGVLVATVYGIIYVQTERTKAIAEARENERSIFRKKMSRDFHDEAGNKITMISLLTDHATRNTSDSKVISTMEQLQDNIQELRSGMQDFIWVLDPAKDNLFDVLVRFRDFAHDSFEYTDIEFQFDSIDPSLEKVEMQGNVRRHFLLIFKEAITNILKYAKASKVKFKFSKNEDEWKFHLKDDGVGFDIDELKRINGLNNMIARGEKINAEVEIVSKSGKGTSIILKWIS